MRDTIQQLLGTAVLDDVPLMGAGLDSLGATELVEKLNSQLSADLQPTALFDYPTASSVTTFLSDHVALPSQDGNMGHARV